MTDELERQLSTAVRTAPADAYPLTDRAEVEECWRVLAELDELTW